jgi:hypothetical protein
MNDSTPVLTGLSVLTDLPNTFCSNTGIVGGIVIIIAEDGP